MYGLDNQPVKLAATDQKELPLFGIDIFEKAAHHVHQSGTFEVEMLEDRPIMALNMATVESLDNALEVGLGDNNPSPEMVAKLRQDVHLFSGCKTYHQMREVSQLLTDADGQVKPIHQFLEEARAIHPQYNEAYLRAEQHFAVASAQAAAQWAEWEKEGDTYDLQYRTAADGDVREEHAALEGVTLPPSDDFWSQYMPPNGWNCRCTVAQVRAGKYPRTEQDRAMKLGDQATTSRDAEGRNRSAMFRFNPGKDSLVFPPDHPYYTHVPDSLKQLTTDE